MTNLPPSTFPPSTFPPLTFPPSTFPAAIIPPSSFGPGFGGEHDTFVPHLASDPGTYWRVSAPDIDGSFGE